ncbi:retrovirus-related pol polyprotein from transposon tnt 1-94, partial [Nicotiana attenuata]
MVDIKPIMDQIHELQILVSKLSDLEVKIPDALQVGAILSKLPSSWNNYRKKILHSTDKLTIEQFRTHLQIESETRARDEIVHASSSTVNTVSQNKSGNENKSLKVSKKSRNKKRNNMRSYHCGKKVHKIRDCRFKKAGINFHSGDVGKSGNSRNSEKVNTVESSSHGLVAMISAIPNEMVKDLNMAATTTKNQDWWLDSCATIHVCHDKNMFKTYSEVKDSEKVLMGNHVTAEVAGKGTVEINFTFGQKLTLLNVFHVPEIMKNLICSSLLSKRGFKIVIESDH